MRQAREIIRLMSTSFPAHEISRRLGMPRSTAREALRRVLSRNYSIDGRGLGRGVGSRRQRMELLRWTQFARRAQLALADHAHEFDTGKGYRG
jgi:hypothetical protein